MQHFFAFNTKIGGVSIGGVYHFVLNIRHKQNHLCGLNLSIFTFLFEFEGTRNSESGRRTGKLESQRTHSTGKAHIPHGASTVAVCDGGATYSQPRQAEDGRGRLHPACPA